MTDDRPKSALKILRMLVDSEYLDIPREFRKMIHHELDVLSEAIEPKEAPPNPQQREDKVKRLYHDLLKKHTRT